MGILSQPGGEGKAFANAGDARGEAGRVPERLGRMDRSGVRAGEREEETTAYI